MMKFLVGAISGLMLGGGMLHFDEAGMALGAVMTILGIVVVSL